MSEHRLDEPRVTRPFIPRMVRTFAIPIIFFWGFLAVTTTAFMPKVEDVAEELAGPMVPHYAPVSVVVSVWDHGSVVTST
jgi:RND superfamily putative drug exporter